MHIWQNAIFKHALTYNHRSCLSLKSVFYMLNGSNQHTSFRADIQIGDGSFYFREHIFFPKLAVLLISGGIGCCEGRERFLVVGTEIFINAGDAGKDDELIGA